MSTETKSKAHLLDMNLYGLQKWPDRMVAAWREAQAPDVDKGRNTGSLRSCGYCGSMHPSDVVAALQAGATCGFADMKYGYPHKLYLDNVPNPHAGELEVRAWSSHPQRGFDREVREPRYDEKTGLRVADHVHYTEQPKPARSTTNGKFYTVHLQDATAEEQEIISKAMGLRIAFNADGSVAWKRYEVQE